MNAISHRSLLARGGLLLAPGAAANTPFHARAVKPQARSGNFKSIDTAMEHAVRDGTVAGVVATAAGPDGMIYEGSFGKANAVTVRHQHGLGRKAGGGCQRPVAGSLFPREHLRPARHDRFRLPDRQQAEGQGRHFP